MLRTTPFIPISDYYVLWAYRLASTGVRNLIRRDEGRGHCYKVHCIEVYSIVVEVFISLRSVPIGYTKLLT